MSNLHDSAARLLEGLGDDPGALAPDLHIDRITCDVQSGAHTELVTLRALADGLQTACTCARSGCVHVRVALRLLAAAGADRSSRPERVSAELRVPAEGKSRERATALCEPLVDVVTAVVRAGVASERVASVLESLSRVEHALPAPLPLGLLRWLGRMREALELQDVALVAHALNAAAMLADDLRKRSGDEPARKRLVSWLGGSANDELECLSDRRMLELAREWLTGTERNQIERRYLLDLDSGEVFREECVRREGMNSLGPCPRSIEVSLAEVELGHVPRRLRLLQYTTTPDVDRASWDALDTWAMRDVESLSASYRAGLLELGALAEPLALVVPQGLQTGSRSKLTFERGAPLLLSADDEPGALRKLESLFTERTPSWVAGRLFQRAGQLMLRPLAAGMGDAAGMRHERL